MTSAAAKSTRPRPDADPARASVSAPTVEEDERLRGLIRAELDRQHAVPVARRTLQLLAEAEAEPAENEAGYRIVDRDGQTRLRRDGLATGEAADGGDATAPLTLGDLVGELRMRYPDLFAAPREPEPEPAPAPPAPDPAHPARDAVAEVRAAGARFVETQSALAKSLASSSAERGRALASAASERFGDWRTQLGERLKSQPAPVPAAALQETERTAGEALEAEAGQEAGRAPSQEPSQAADRAGGPTAEREAGPATPAPEATSAGGAPTFQAAGLRLRAGAARFGQLGSHASERTRGGIGEGARRLADLTRRGRDAMPSLDDLALPGLRIGLAGLGVVAVLLAAFVLYARRDSLWPFADGGARTTRAGVEPGGVAGEPSREASEQTTEEPPRQAVERGTRPSGGQAAPRPGAKPEPRTGARGAADPEATSDDAEAAPAEEAPQSPRNPNEIVAVPQVVDTATLRMSGKVVRLFGVEWVRGGQAEELTKYLRGRTVTCRPAPGSSASLCSVDGRDLSEVVLFNGGGRASSEASPDLVAAEDHARGERLGIWKR